MLWAVAAVLAVFVVAFGFSRWARAVPVAYAWDPNSHDKITSHALTVLETDSWPTLLGWVLSRSRTPSDLAHHFKRAIESQIRRGAVEEDMNSYLLTRAPYEFGEYDTLEGANGGYHFFNPLFEGPGKGPGLSDTTVWLIILGKLGSGAQSPMPSAIQRAFDSPFSDADPGWEIGPALTNWDLGDLHIRAWHLDKEERNYSVGDAGRYYKAGYSHLSFYSIGRVCHLLQDMAVPAHVRNDAHPGGMVQKFGCDPSDPLEVYADGLDKPDGGFQDSPAPHKWAFSWTREYPSAGAAFENGKAEWDLMRTASDGSESAIRSLFLRLARDTHTTNYSYNTIPGNANSHGPSSPDATPVIVESGHAIDWKHCGPSIDACCLLLRVLAQDAWTVVERQINRQPAAAWIARDRLVALERTLSTFFKTLNSLRKRSDAPVIVGIGPTLAVPLDVFKRMTGLVDEVHAGIAPMREPLDAEWQQTGYFASDKTERDEQRQALARFLERYEQIDMASLVAASDSHSDVAAILQDWLTNHQNLPGVTRAYSTWDPLFDDAIADSIPQGLMTTVVNWMRESYLNGPFCLTHEIIDRQWKERQARAVAHTASLLASWFSAQFTKLPATDVWLNKDTGEASIKPTISPSKIVEGTTDTVDASKVALIGIANHLPVPVDMTIEFEILPEGTDEDLLKDGVELHIERGRLRPGSIGGEVGEDSVAGAIAAYLDAVGSRQPWGTEELEAVALGNGSESSGPTKAVRTVTAVDPYNLEALMRLRMARGAWSPDSTDMGGITRAVEGDSTKFPFLWVSPNEGQGSPERLSASFLRIVPKARVPESAAPAESAAGGPSGSGS
jgi:hypothetical protein